MPVDDLRDQLSRDHFSRDQLSIETPEQVSLHFEVAGLGSRFLAIVADSLLQFACYVLLVITVVLVAYSAPASVRDAQALTPTAEKWLIAGFILFNFVLYWGYFTLFEVFWRGQTPGKRWLKIRVIKDSGRQITFFEALARNLVRTIDMLPSIYLVGAVTMMCNRQHKRLGDLVAGTLVVHERGQQRAQWSSGTRTITAGLYQPPEPEKRQRPAGVQLPADMISKLSTEDLIMIETFFARALDLELETRASIAAKMLHRLSQKMGTPVPEGKRAETVLEAIAYEMRSQGGLH
jgi:uncharacterized RDD family membrane protein YckC